MTTAAKIEIIWDDRDANSTGWAWYTYDADGRLVDSGPVDGRQSQSVRPSRARVMRSLTSRVERGAEIIFPEITGRGFCG
jgi:hypothetical protein